MTVDKRFCLMQIENQIFERIKELEREHDSDKDGGYSLVDEICQEYRSSPVENQQVFLEILLSLVESRHPTLWGVALEAIVRCRMSAAGAKLFEFIRTYRLPDDRFDAVIMALINLHYVGGRRTIFQYVERGVREGRPEVIPMVASMCKVDRYEYLRLASKYLRTAVEGPGIEKVAGAFVRNIADVDLRLMKELLFEIRRVNPKAAKTVAAEFTEYLNRPYVRDAIDPVMAAELESYCRLGDLILGGAR